MEVSTANDRTADEDDFFAALMNIDADDVPDQSSTKNNPQSPAPTPKKPTNPQNNDKNNSQPEDQAVNDPYEGDIPLDDDVIDTNQPRQLSIFDLYPDFTTNRYLRQRYTLSVTISPNSFLQPFQQHDPIIQDLETLDPHRKVQQNRTSKVASSSSSAPSSFIFPPQWYFMPSLHVYTAQLASSLLRIKTTSTQLSTRVVTQLSHINDTLHRIDSLLSSYQAAIQRVSPSVSNIISTEQTKQSQNSFESLQKLQQNETRSAAVVNALHAHLSFFIVAEQLQNRLKTMQSVPIASKLHVKGGNGRFSTTHRIRHSAQPSFEPLPDISATDEETESQTVALIESSPLTTNTATSLMPSSPSSSRQPRHGVSIHKHDHAMRYSILLAQFIESMHDDEHQLSFPTSQQPHHVSTTSFPTSLITIATLSGGTACLRHPGAFTFTNWLSEWSSSSRFIHLVLLYSRHFHQKLHPSISRKASELFKSGINLFIATIRSQFDHGVQIILDSVLVSTARFHSLTTIAPSSQVPTFVQISNISDAPQNVVAQISELSQQLQYTHDQNDDYTPHGDVDDTVGRNFVGFNWLNLAGTLPLLSSFLGLGVTSTLLHWVLASARPAIRELEFYAFHSLNVRLQQRFDWECVPQSPSQSSTGATLPTPTSSIATTALSEHTNSSPFNESQTPAPLGEPVDIVETILPSPVQQLLRASLVFCLEKYLDLRLTIISLAPSDIPSEMKAKTTREMQASLSRGLTFDDSLFSSIEPSSFGTNAYQSSSGLLRQATTDLTTVAIATAKQLIFSSSSSSSSASSGSQNGSQTNSNVGTQQPASSSLTSSMFSHLAGNATFSTYLHQAIHSLTTFIDMEQDHCMIYPTQYPAINENRGKIDVTGGRNLENVCLQLYSTMASSPQDSTNCNVYHDHSTFPHVESNQQSTVPDDNHQAAAHQLAALSPVFSLISDSHVLPYFHPAVAANIHMYAHVWLPTQINSPSHHQKQHQHQPLSPQRRFSPPHIPFSVFTHFILIFLLRQMQSECFLLTSLFTVEPNINPTCISANDFRFGDYWSQLYFYHLPHRMSTSSQTVTATTDERPFFWETSNTIPPTSSTTSVVAPSPPRLLSHTVDSTHTSAICEKLHHICLFYVHAVSSVFMALLHQLSHRQSFVTQDLLPSDEMTTSRVPLSSSSPSTAASLPSAPLYSIPFLHTRAGLSLLTNLLTVLNAHRSFLKDSLHSTGYFGFLYDIERSSTFSNTATNTSQSSSASPHVASITATSTTAGTTTSKMTQEGSPHALSTSPPAISSSSPKRKPETSLDSLFLQCVQSPLTLPLALSFLTVVRFVQSTEKLFVHALPQFMTYYTRYIAQLSRSHPLAPPPPRAVQTEAVSSSLARFAAAQQQKQSSSEILPRQLFGHIAPFFVNLYLAIFNPDVAHDTHTLSRLTNQFITNHHQQQPSPSPQEQPSQEHQQQSVCSHSLHVTAFDSEIMYLASWASILAIVYQSAQRSSIPSISSGADSGDSNDDNIAAATASPHKPSTTVPSHIPAPTPFPLFTTSPINSLLSPDSDPVPSSSSPAALSRFPPLLPLSDSNTSHPRSTSLLTAPTTIGPWLIPPAWSTPLQFFSLYRKLLFSPSTCATSPSQQAKPSTDILPPVETPALAAAASSSVSSPASATSSISSSPQMATTLLSKHTHGVTNPHSVNLLSPRDFPVVRVQTIPTQLGAVQSSSPKQISSSSSASQQTVAADSFISLQDDLVNSAPSPSHMAVSLFFAIHQWIDRCIHFPSANGVRLSHQNHGFHSFTLGSSFLAISQKTSSQDEQQQQQQQQQQHSFRHMFPKHLFVLSLPQSNGLLRYSFSSIGALRLKPNHALLKEYLHVWASLQTSQPAFNLFSPHMDNPTITSVQQPQHQQCSPFSQPSPCGFLYTSNFLPTDPSLSSRHLISQQSIVPITITSECLSSSSYPIPFFIEHQQQPQKHDQSSSHQHRKASSQPTSISSLWLISNIPWSTVIASPTSSTDPTQTFSDKDSIPVSFFPLGYFILSLRLFLTTLILDSYVDAESSSSPLVTSPSSCLIDFFSSSLFSLISPFLASSSDPNVTSTCIQTTQQISLSSQFEFAPNSIQTHPLYKIMTKKTIQTGHGQASDGRIVSSCWSSLFEQEISNDEFPGTNATGRVVDSAPSQGSQPLQQNQQQQSTWGGYLSSFLPQRVNSVVSTAVNIVSAATLTSRNQSLYDTNKLSTIPSDILSWHSSRTFAQLSFVCAMWYIAPTMLGVYTNIIQPYYTHSLQVTQHTSQSTSSSSSAPTLSLLLRPRVATTLHAELDLLLHHHVSIHPLPQFSTEQTNQSSATPSASFSIFDCKIHNMQLLVQLIFAHPTCVRDWLCVFLPQLEYIIGVSIAILTKCVDEHAVSLSADPTAANSSASSVVSLQKSIAHLTTWKTTVSQMIIMKQ